MIFFFNRILITNWLSDCVKSHPFLYQNESNSQCLEHLKREIEIIFVLFSVWRENWFGINMQWRSTVSTWPLHLEDQGVRRSEGLRWGRRRRQLLIISLENSDHPFLLLSNTSPSRRQRSSVVIYCLGTHITWSRPTQRDGYQPRRTNHCVYMLPF